MKLSTWLLNRKLYFHENAEPISSVKDSINYESRLFLFKSKHFLHFSSIY